MYPLDTNIEELFIAYRHDVYKFLIYYTRTFDVEDLVQETFIKALKGLRGFQGDSNVRTWLFSIARNVAIDYQRKKRPIVQFVKESKLVNVASNAKTPEQVVELTETTKFVLNVLGNLNPRFREVIVLRGVHDLSSKETARILGWTTTKVNVTFHRAIKAAQELLIQESGGFLENGMDG
ncbi:RNA polymerase sigma factor [Alicyclobacillus tolerans]|uniref:RNA polymerase sigma factor n=1 Tax=Alicyclobacillus tolerans TaxID=90970 RepID=UPI001F42D9F6|nr:RNA polymerase sigma factor [Alicyclobacillus tolerans]MCF8568376.1 RNA polymerase sigma factor [Alicyclobacillus tolerans]